MDPKFRSSFIPKSSLSASSTQSKKKRRRHFSLISFLSTLVFIVSIGGTGGFFVYAKVIERNISDKGIRLKAAQERLDIDEISKFKRFDDRLKLLKILLENHISLTTFIEYLKTATLKGVQYDSFSFSLVEGNDVRMGMKGKAISFNTLALQSEIFKNTSAIKTLGFSNILVTEEGLVEFTLDIIIDRQEISYANLFDPPQQESSTEDLANEL